MGQAARLSGRASGPSYIFVIVDVAYAQIWTLPGYRYFAQTILLVIELHISVLFAELVDAAGHVHILLTILEDLFDAPLTPPTHRLQAIGAFADLQPRRLDQSASASAAGLF